MDTNINNYTPEEMTQILGLTYPAKTRDIITKSNEYIKKYTKKNNTQMATFFQNIQNELVDDNDARQGEKDQESSNVYNVPVQKDTLNPILKNTTTRIVNIDSQYRDYTYEDSLFQNSLASYSTTEYSSTYFNANLTEPLLNVLSITVQNVIIPKTWYVIDSAYNNNFFWITNLGIDYLIALTPGNYNASEFVNEVNTALTNCGFVSSSAFCSINSNSNKFSFLFSGATDPSGAPISIFPGDLPVGDTTNEEVMRFMVENYAYFTFFDIGNIKFFKQFENDVNPCTLTQGSIDATLGWFMGFRAPYLFMKDVTTATVAINLTGTSYFLLSLADYQTNRVYTDIVNIANTQNSHINIPSYINASLLYTCIKQKYDVSINSQKSLEDLLFKNSLLSDQSSPQYVPTAPRILTQTQLYTTNQIIKHNEKTMNYRVPSPSTNDVLTLIPINIQGINNQNLYIQDKLQSNKRLFFGPVNIDRFTVRLLNDKGQLVNLNGSDWSFTLNVELLYQI